MMHTIKKTVKKAAEGRGIFRHLALCIILPFVLGGCMVFKGAKDKTIPVESAFRLVSPKDYPAFADLKDKPAVLLAAKRSLEYLEGIGGAKTLYQIGDKRITSAYLAKTLREFISVYSAAQTPEQLQKAIAEKFELYQSVGQDGKGKVIFSSYYEPVLNASLTKTDKYKYPIYAVPPDLIEVNLEKFNEDKWKGEKISGKLEKKQLVPYFSREDIDINKALEGRGLEVAWFDDKFDIMDLHIEGSAKLKLPDGRAMLARYAGTNSLKFRGPVTTLIELGLLKKNELSHANAKKYLAQRKDLEPWILATNKRYTFFEVVPMVNPDDGPNGTIDKPLVGGHSIAIDRKYIPLGAIAFMQTSMPKTDNDGTLLGLLPDSRFVMCQDTGGAILGPGRVDFFAGSGQDAKDIAVNLWEPGKLFVLLLRD